MSWAKRAGELAVILLLSTIVFILVGEIFLRVYLARNIFYDVEMARYADTLKIDAGNPLIGHVHRPKGSAELMGVNVEISSAGLRDSEYPLDK